MVGKFILGSIGLILAAVFFAIPIVKIREPSLIVVVLIGIGLAVYEFAESLREKD
jgi:hypothetical protein